jgi:hypothetical protein
MAIKNRESQKRINPRSRADETDETKKEESENQVKKGG